MYGEQCKKTKTRKTKKQKKKKLKKKIENSDLFNETNDNEQSMLRFISAWNNNSIEKTNRINKVKKFALSHQIVENSVEPVKKRKHPKKKDEETQGYSEDLPSHYFAIMKYTDKCLADDKTNFFPKKYEFLLRCFSDITGFNTSEINNHLSEMERHLLTNQINKTKHKSKKKKKNEFLDEELIF